MNDEPAERLIGNPSNLATILEAPKQEKPSTAKRSPYARYEDAMSTKLSPAQMTRMLVDMASIADVSDFYLAKVLGDKAVPQLAFEPFVNDETIDIGIEYVCSSLALMIAMREEECPLSLAIAFERRKDARLEVCDARFTADWAKRVAGASTS